MAAAKPWPCPWVKPLYGVNHLSAHVAVDQLQHGPLPEGCIALLASGGHSSILRVGDVTADVEPLGATIDDAAGEAFDKVARMLGLGFPGGRRSTLRPVTATGRRSHSPGLTGPRDALYDYSFSGLKTAVKRWLEANPQAPVADVAASFQEAVADVPSAKALAACRDTGGRHLILGGGWLRTRGFGR